MSNDQLKPIASNARAHQQARIRNDSGTPYPPMEPLPESPTPAASAPAHAPKPARPTTLAEAAPWLAKPFPEKVVELKPTATTQDKSRALASPYVDMRCYYNRLDKICGPESWSSSITLTDRGAVCSLTIFGVTKSATGDYPQGADDNPATSAEAQAFKRACSAFGLGRYLYSLPQVWADYDQKTKQIVGAAGVVAQMYATLPRDE